MNTYYLVGEEGIENKETLDHDDDCDVDSLDSAIDPEEHRALPPALVRISNLLNVIL